MATTQPPADQRDLATRALQKLNAGERPTQREQRALDRFKAEQEEASRCQHYATLPVAHWVKMCGQQRRDLHRLAATFGAPFPSHGDTIDLATIVRWLHAFLRANEAKLLAQPDDPAALLAGPSTPALERLREETWLIRRLERQKLEGSLIDVSLFHSLFLESFVLQCRRATELLDLQFGPDAGDVLRDVLESSEQALEKLAQGANGDGKRPGSDDREFHSHDRAQAPAVGDRPSTDQGPAGSAPRNRSRARRHGEATDQNR